LKKDLDPKIAREIAEDFLEKTGDLYGRCELAGSLRRKEPVVHDIDFAVIPKGDDLGAWKRKVTERVNAIDGAVSSFGDVISNFLYRDVQVNLFLCPSEDVWGVTLMWATGPKGHTIGMTIKARNRGLLINSTGIWTRENPPRLVGARTEEEVGAILGWTYKPPEERGKTSKEKTPAFFW
jgi:DNA polymerase/3'-5' exonuclease PolX